MNITIELLIWLAAALGGLVISILALREAQSDQKYLQESGFNGVRGIVARNAIRREGLRLTAQVMSSAIGLMALFSPAPEPRPARTVAGTVFAVLLIAYSCIFTINSALDRRMRHKLHTAIAARDVSLHGNGESNPDQASPETAPVDDQTQTGG